MRKRTITSYFDQLFWFLIYALPLLVILFACFRNGYSGMSDVVNWLDGFSYGVVWDWLTDFLAYFEFDDLIGVLVCDMLAYYVNVSLLHLLVDFLLFIPRLAGKWMDGITHTEH